MAVSENGMEEKKGAERVCMLQLAPVDDHLMVAQILGADIC